MAWPICGNGRIFIPTIAYVPRFSAGEPACSPENRFNAASEKSFGRACEVADVEPCITSESFVCTL
jgi:hypothetical protein